MVYLILIDIAWRWRRRCCVYRNSSFFCRRQFVFLLSSSEVLLSDSIFRTNHNSNLIRWLPISKQSPLSNHLLSFAIYLSLKVPAMVISWSRRVLLLFSSLLLSKQRSIISWNSVCESLRLTSVRLYWFVLFLTENPVYLTRNANLSYNLCSLMYCVCLFCKYFWIEK